MLDTAVSNTSAPETQAKPSANSDWRVLLQTTKDGDPLTNLYNAKIVFSHAAQMRGCLGFDSFAHEYLWLLPPPWDMKSPPRPLNDNDVREALAWVQETQKIAFAKGTVEDALLAVATSHSFHPVRDYLASLRWDGVSRIDSWLIDHLGAADTPLNRAYGAKTLIGAVARITKPGCLMKTVLTLEGPQDIGKSSALRALMPESSWFTDHVEDIGSKDSRMQIRGVWLVEFAEFEALSRADANKAKSFISSPSDRYRPPYGHYIKNFPRECIFTISINPGAGGYLKDATGNVRYWVVECGSGWRPGRKIDVESIASARDQLWAEAAARYQAGETWWLEDASLVAAQADVNDDRSMIDPWHDAIAAWLADKPAIEAQDILCDCLGIAKAMQHRGHQMRVNSILTMLGYRRKRFRVRPGVPLVWAYYLPGGDDSGHQAALDHLRAKTPALSLRIVHESEPTSA